jgi:hypothetical protein
VTAFALAHAPVWVCVAALYFVDLRALTLGGKDDYSIPAVICSTVSLLLGGPSTGWIAWLVLAVGIGAFAASLVMLYRRGSDEWVFFLTSILLSPALLLVIQPPHALYERYFVVSAACLLLLLAHGAAVLYRRGKPGQVLALAALALVLAGNLAHLQRLLELGRGSYLRALLFIAERTPGDRLTISSNHDFRNRLVLTYYGAYLPVEKQIVYFEQGQGGEAPEWLLVDRFDRDPAPPERIGEPSTPSYSLAARFPHAGLSGWTWYVFHRDPPRP